MVTLWLLMNSVVVKCGLCMCLDEEAVRNWNIKCLTVVNEALIFTYNVVFPSWELFLDVVVSTKQPPNVFFMWTSLMNTIHQSQYLAHFQVEAGHISTGASIVVHGIVVGSPGSKQKIELKAHKIVTVSIFYFWGCELCCASF